ncbi:U32 family peptidase [Lachnospiraceae bacterium ZAX-1]
METNNKIKKTELLSPAGSFQTLKAVVNAGADAVYAAGNRFGARAYAANFTDEELCEAIDFVHLHGKKLYLTVNTLLKESELESELYDYLALFYEQGLDAVIVQDFGVLSFVKKEFPNLNIHASTQMNITGSYGASFLKEAGCSRIVTARELSLEEISNIQNEVEIEIESFVHGALCYCYSGQCLFSSLLGGRSGNRGRCAQPCRLLYNGAYLLSPKDLCTIELIPRLVESGIHSFKIEGRMKQAEYAAGVTSIYRKYLDLYENSKNDEYKTRTEEETTNRLETDEARPDEARPDKARTDKARTDGASKTTTDESTKYKVLKEDLLMLHDLGQRSGFTKGYYLQHNGKDMITLDKSAHAKGNENLQEQVRQTFLKMKMQEKIKGNLILFKGKSAILTLKCQRVEVTVAGAVVEKSIKQPLTKKTIEEKLNKTGNAPFKFEELAIEMEPDVFCSVSELNQLRRDGMEKLKEELLKEQRRELPARADRAKSAILKCKISNRDRRTVLSVLIEEMAYLPVLLDCSYIDTIYIDVATMKRESIIKELSHATALVHCAGKKIYGCMPAVFRQKTATWYTSHISAILAIGLDGFLVHSYDELMFLLKMHVPAEHIITDSSLYTFSNQAVQAFLDLGIQKTTLPVELNKRELQNHNCAQGELLIYGYLPLMISAQCTLKNTIGCRHQEETSQPLGSKTPCQADRAYFPTKIENTSLSDPCKLTDRYHKQFFVKNYCEDCYNIIYNTTPLVLLHHANDIRGLDVGSLRMSFINETPGEIKRLLALYESAFLKQETIDIKQHMKDFTNGHFTRGVE